MYGALKAHLDAGADASARYEAGVTFDAGSPERNGDGLNSYKRWSTNVVVRPPSYTIETASAMVRAELLPTLAVGFYGIFRVNVSAAMRVQADLDFATPDAVLCDVPYCGTSGFPLYVTWQPRLIVAVSDLRLRDLVGKMPAVGSIVSDFISGDMRLIHDSEVINNALGARNLLTGACLPIPRMWTLASNLQWAAQSRNLAEEVGTGWQPRLRAPAARRLQGALPGPHVDAEDQYNESRLPALQLSPALRQLQTFSEGLDVAVTATKAPTPYNLVAQASQVYSFWVVDSTVPVAFHLSDDQVSSCVFGTGNSNLKLQAYVQPPSFGGMPTDNTGSFVGSVAWTDYTIAQGSTWANTYVSKGTQGFGHTGSYYYVQ